jgi:hypothetical protein
MSNSLFRRFVKEESGMTMGLVVIMIVLIGVMGAGLLTFVQRDLENVVEVNRGQKAIEVSDAGVQAARRQLLVNSFPNQYNDPNGPATTPLSPEASNSPWAFDSGSATCGSPPEMLAAGPGRCITTPEGNVRVTIKYLPPSTTEAERKDPNFAPEVLPSKDQRDYFRVETDGVFSGARRKIQAILVTEDLNLPKAYFATQDIEVGSSSTTITNVSLFARGNITGLREDMLVGEDKAYGDWKNDSNNKARLGTTGVLSGATKAAGAGAEGIIEYNPSSYNSDQRSAPAANTDRYKRLDFDAGAGSAAPTPDYRFCNKGSACWPAGAPQPANVISYPFNDGRKLDAGFLQSIAEQQVNPSTSASNYKTQAAGNVNVDSDTFYQVAPALSSVYVVKFTGASPGNVDLSTNNGQPCLSGTLLVINGSVDTANSGEKCFNGIIAVQKDPEYPTTNLEYRNIGNFTLNGFANIEGTMKIRGSVSPIVTNDVLNQPGYHDVKTWSWRECYKEACN